MVFKVSEIRDCITLQFRDDGTFLVPVATAATHLSCPLTSSVCKARVSPGHWAGPRTCDSRSRVLRCSPTGFDFGSDRGASGARGTSVGQRDFWC